MIDPYQSLLINMAGFAIATLAAILYCIASVSWNRRLRGGQAWIALIVVVLISSALQMLVLQGMVNGSEIGLGQERLGLLLRNLCVMGVAFAWLRRKVHSPVSVARATGIGILSAPIGYLIASGFVYALGIVFVISCFTGLLSCRT